MQSAIQSTVCGALSGFDATVIGQICGTLKITDLHALSVSSERPQPRGPQHMVLAQP